MTLLEQILKEIPSKKQHKLIILKNKSIELYDQIINQTNFLEESTNLSIRLKFLENNISSLPLCKTCSIPHQYLNDKGNISEYCSKECYYNDKESFNLRCKKVNQQEKIRKLRQTNLERYGVEYQSQRKEVKKILSKSKLEKNNSQALEYLNNKEWLIEQYKTKTAVEIAEILNVYYGTVIWYLKKYEVKIKHHINRSKIEKEIISFINSFNIETKTSIKGLLENNNLELDIFIPNFNMAIEVNGLYWHSCTSQTQKDRNRHLTKLNLCLDKNISLLQFTDEEWIYKQDICKSILMNKLKLNTKINGRDCSVTELTTHAYKDFCITNHISGSSIASIRLGLMYKDELVQVMSFSKSRFDKKYEYELIRLCTKKFNYVIGGTSKLFSFFKNKYYPNSIISYANRFFGEGNVYLNLDFILNGSTKPGYRWTDGNISFNRLDFQKHKLKDKLKIFDPALSETDNMFNNNYRLFWDCGHNIWIWNKYKY
jgi:hypothetical protein